jgi:hypothetical protein
LKKLHVWSEPQQTPLQTLSSGQQVPFTHRPEQQSLLLLQPESPPGMQLTQVMVVVSQLFEQQSASLVQAPASALQQVPLTQVLLPVQAAPLPQTQV